MPFRVNQWASAIAWIDWRIGLNVDHRIIGLDLPRDCADDTHADRIIQPKRIPERKHDLPLLQFVGVAKHKIRQVSLINFYECQITLTIHADEGAGKGPAGSPITLLTSFSCGPDV